MGLIKSAVEGEEPEDEENDPAAIEEKYEKLFMKIGRDFVHRDDFVRVVGEILELLIANGIADDKTSVGEFSIPGAHSRAVEYKEILDSGEDGSKIYEDLIDLSDE